MRGGGGGYRDQITFCGQKLVKAIPDHVARGYLLYLFYLIFHWVKDKVEDKILIKNK